MTIDFLISARKGYYNTIDGWRKGRNEEGFKDEGYSSQNVLDHHIFRGTMPEEENEKMMKLSAEGEDQEEVLASSELFQSMDFVDAILEGDVPTKYPIPFTNTVALFYGFVNSSGRGFAGSFEGANLPDVAVDIGVWSASEKD